MPPDAAIVVLDFKSFTEVTAPPEMVTSYCDLRIPISSRSFAFNVGELGEIVIVDTPLGSDRTALESASLEIR
jgi:hypothetical protein